MNIPEHTRTIFAFSVVCLLESKNSLTITVIRKLKNFFTNIGNILKSKLEKYYETRLFAMCLKEDGTAKTLYLSQSSFPTKIYVNVYKHHLSFITDIKMYSKQYICSRCDKLFVEMRNLNKHQPKCDSTVEYTYTSGMYKNKLSVFEELEEMGVQVREEDKYEKWFA